MLLGIPFLLIAHISVVKTITCRVNPGSSTCIFRGVIIKKNETVSIATDPVDVDVNRIKFVEFWTSSIYSVPREVFTKFPNLGFLYAIDQNIQEIKADTFENAKLLRSINLRDNALQSSNRKRTESL
jgi:hypothetical protein